MTETTETITSKHMQIAKIILDQLGGNKFVAMTGARNLMALPPNDDGKGPGLAFLLPGRPNYVKDSIRVIEVILDPSDTYTVTGYKLDRRSLKNRIQNPKPLREVVTSQSDVYAEDLPEVFRRMTGLATSLR